MTKTMLTQLTELIEAHNLFVRERKPNWLRAMGIALLYFGMSCRKTAEVLSFFDEASYEAGSPAVVPSGSKYALCTAETVQANSSDRRDEGEGGGTWYYSSSGRLSTRRTGSCFASRSRRHETATMLPVSYDGCYRRARTHRRCS